MIALPKDKDVDEAQKSLPPSGVILFSPVVCTDTDHAAQMAQAQQELAMLTRALTKCGLIQKQSKERN